MSDYTAVVADLLMRRNELERQVGAMRGDITRLDEAIAVLQPMAQLADAGSSRTDQIVAYVTDARKWLTHSEIVRGVVPGLGQMYSRQRHVVRSQVGQLVQAGRLRQSQMLIGLPTWEPPQLTSLQPDTTSSRNGRCANIELVLRNAGRAMHIKDVCAELLRRGSDADERCVSSALAVHAKSKRARWRKVGPAMFQIAKSIPETIPVMEEVQ